MRISYENQPEVAAGMKKAYADIPGLKREDIFIVSGHEAQVKKWLLSNTIQTSKLWNKYTTVRDDWPFYSER